MKNFLKAALALAGLVVSFAPSALAVNKFYMKPDSANNAVCTAWGSPNTGLACGKTTAPNYALDLVGDQAASGKMGVGGNPVNFVQLNVTAANASSTGTIVNSAASPTADIAEFQLNGAIVATITPQGMFKPYPRTLAQIRLMTPLTQELGALVTCVDCANVYTVCRSTGTTIQGFSLGASGALAECK